LLLLLLLLLLESYSSQLSHCIAPHLLLLLQL
jgi:hypothetical protein